MSGHSKWSTIKRQKGAADAKRGAVFTKLGNAIAIAVREGRGVDQAIEKARAANMPKENIQRCLDRGMGKSGEAELTTAIFEGFAPSSVAVIVEVITDNTTRTGSELRKIFEKHGGHLAGPGAVSYLFSKVGEIEINKANKANEIVKQVALDEVFEKAVEVGALDVEENLTSGTFSVYTRVEDLHRIKDAMNAAGFAIRSSEFVYRPNKEATVKITDGEQRQKIEDFLEAVGDLDGVQEIYTNLAVI